MPGAARVSPSFPGLHPLSLLHPPPAREQLAGAQGRAASRDVDLGAIISCLPHVSLLIKVHTLLSPEQDVGGRRGSASSAAAAALLLQSQV